MRAAPDLALEVVSPSETADEVRDKVHDYLQAGTPLVWVVYPRSKEVVVHTPDGLARTVSGDDRLEDWPYCPASPAPSQISSANARALFRPSIQHTSVTSENGLCTIKPRQLAHKHKLCSTITNSSRSLVLKRRSRA